MIFKIYFIVTQVLVILSYFFFQKENWSSDRYSIFKNKIHYTVVVICAMVVGVSYNFDYQIFCNPVNWTLLILFPVGLWLAFYPFLQHKKLRHINGVFYGLSLFVLFYILVFAQLEYLVFLLVFSVMFIPLYLLVSLARKKTGNNQFDFLNYYGFCVTLPLLLLYVICSKFHHAQFSKKLTFATIIFLSSISLFSTIKIQHTIEVVDNNRNNLAIIQQLKANQLDRYYLELVLGMHWKYHTEICLYDGWRPPFHDPFIPIAKIIISPFGHFHHNLPLDERKKLYAKVFPTKKMWLDCKCAKYETWPAGTFFI